jgi:hypothetical protein
MQNLLHSTWEHENLYADIPSKDEKLLTNVFYEKPKFRMWRAVGH